jgi:hypothetical protein
MGNIAKARIKHLLKRSHADYFDNVADSIVTLSDSQTLSGNTSVQKCAVASGSNDAVSLTAAANGGRVTWVPDLTADRIYTLPTPAAGLHLNVVGAGALAADGHDISFIGTDDTHFFHGAIIHHDTAQSGQTSAVVWGDGAADDVIKLDLVEAFDIHFLGKSTTVWYVWGWSAAVAPITISNA